MARQVVLGRRAPRSISQHSFSRGNTVRYIVAVMATAVQLLAGQSGTAWAQAHAPAPVAQDAQKELKNFKPEFFPDKVQARLYLRDKRLSHLPPPGNGLQPQQWIIHVLRLWDAGDTVTVAFRKTDKDLTAVYQKIEDAANEWTKH